MKTKAKVAFINCYFGNFPDYFNLFLKSCSYNPDYDFLLFSDAPWSQPLPDNVHIIPFSFKKLCDLASEKLGFPINLDNPYKACDFKPSYGYILEEYLKEYSFWGLCDLDMILGNLKDMVWPHIKDADIFSAREEYFSGALAVLRNTEKVNRLFLKSAKVKEIFQDNQFRGFDECHEDWQFLIDGGDIFESSKAKESFSYVLFRERDAGRIRLNFQTNILESRAQIFNSGAIWNQGKVYSQGREYSAIHFVATKRKFHFLLPKWRVAPEKIRISKLGLSYQSGLSGFIFSYITRYGILAEKAARKTMDKLRVNPSA